MIQVYNDYDVRPYVLWILCNLLQDPALLEFAWIELLETNKSVTVEELAEVCVLKCDV